MAARPWRVWLYVGAVIASGAALAIRFTPSDVTDAPLASGLLAASLLLSMFKLRLPLGRGVSTMSLACVAP